MKIRSGFVSNSSSSSFIIIVKRNKECPTCKRADPNFLDFVDKIGQGEYGCSDSTKVEARGGQETINYINDSFQYNDDVNDESTSRWKKVFTKIKKVGKGKEVGMVTISYHDEITNQEFQHQLHTKSIQKIWPEKEDENE